MAIYAKTAAGLMKPGARLRVSVTQDDIEGARRGDSYECPIAIAIARTLPAAYHIRVDDRTIRFTLDGYRFTYTGHPWRVEKYIRDFDAGTPPQPFGFWIHRPKAAKVATPAKAPSQRRTKAPVSGEKTADSGAASKGRPRRTRTYGSRQPGWIPTSERYGKNA